MRFFSNANDAKDFFIAKIVEQARLEHVPLSDVETRMLHWTEVHPIPGMDRDALQRLSEEFDQQCNSDEYESKIVGLLQRAYERDSSDEQKTSDYRSAYEVLSREDHYLLVMIDASITGKLRKNRFLGIF